MSSFEQLGQPFDVYRVKFVSAKPGPDDAWIDLDFLVLNTGGRLTRRVSTSLIEGDNDAAFLLALASGDTSLTPRELLGREFELHLLLKPIPDCPRTVTFPVREVVEKDNACWAGIMAARKCIDSGDGNRALSILTNVIVSESNHAVCFNEVGIAHSQLKNEEIALAYFERALEANRTDEAFFNLLMLLKSMGKIEAARRRFVEFETHFSESDKKSCLCESLFGFGSNKSNQESC